MTPQIPDTVIYKGEAYYTSSDPFFYYRHSFKPKDRPLFYGYSTANHNGYVADYEVREDKLYLIKFEGNLIITQGKEIEYKEVELDAISPGQTEVFADWFTGDLILITPDKYNWSYEKKEPEEKQLHLYIEKGLLLFSGMVNNKVIDRISNLHWDLYNLKHRKKRTIWYYIGHKFFPKWVYDEQDYW